MDLQWGGKGMCLLLPHGLPHTLAPLPHVLPHQIPDPLPFFPPLPPPFFHRRRDLPPAWSPQELWLHWQKQARPRGLQLVPCGGLNESHLPSLFDPLHSCLPPVLAMRGPLCMTRVQSTWGPTDTLAGLFDNLSLTLASKELLHTLTPTQQTEVANTPRLLFSYQPAALLTRGSAHPSPVCSPFSPARVAAMPGFLPTPPPKEYLRVYLGTMGPRGAVVGAYEYAHRLVAAATLGADWHAALGIHPPPPPGRTRFEVSHICGNAWCLCPSHLKVVDNFRHNVIELPHLRPMRLS